VKAALCAVLTVFSPPQNRGKTETTWWLEFKERVSGSTNAALNMDDHDPISHFFPDQEFVDLYEVLNLRNTATQDEVRKAYKRLALLHHPDKHASASDEAKEAASLRFQQIGFSYAVLSDGKRKERYDKTGSTGEGFDLGPGDQGWKTYFEDLFEGITRQKLDEMKNEYQGYI